MTDETTFEARDIQRRMRDLDEAIADAVDLGMATRLRGQHRALLHRMAELDENRLRPSAGSIMLGGI